MSKQNSVTCKHHAAGEMLKKPQKAEQNLNELPIEEESKDQRSTLDYKNKNNTLNNQNTDEIGTTIGTFVIASATRNKRKLVTASYTDAKRTRIQQELEITQKVCEMDKRIDLLYEDDVTKILSDQQIKMIFF